jgi:hypothetical protein
VTRAGLTLVVLVVLAVACDGAERTAADCAESTPDASVEIASTYRYSGALRGEIDFEREGDTVRLTRTSYENADDRPLVGSGTLAGNTLEMQLVPENGDTDYQADVRFVFDNAGETFCVQFSDTNGDQGALGSYTGVRR